LKPHVFTDVIYNAILLSIYKEVKRGQNNILLSLNVNIGLAALLVIMSVATFKTAVILEID